MIDCERREIIFEVEYLAADCIDTIIKNLHSLLILPIPIIKNW